MMKHEVKDTGEALAYIVDCTLATVIHMAMKKSRPKGEYERQISIASAGIKWMIEMGVDTKGTRSERVNGHDVAEYARKYEVQP